MHGSIAKAGLALAIACTGLGASAQAPGVTQNEILIGHDVDLSGSIAVRMKTFIQAADAYFEHVNQAGGVNGRKIRIVRVDSANKPERTKENVRTLVEEKGVFALWGMSGTGNVAAALPYLTERGVPLISSTSGADPFYQKAHAVLINVKAGYGDEIRRMVAHLKETQVERIGLIYLDNGFGREVRKTALEAAKANQMEVVAEAAHKEDMSDVAEAVQKVAKAAPSAVLMLTLAGPAPKVIDAYLKTGVATQMFALSIVASDSLYKALGERARGVIVTQIVPFPWDRNIPLVREYQDTLRAKGVTDYSPTGMEGFLCAKALVLGLQGAGRKPTREGLIQAYENMRAVDIGGVKLAYSPTDHNGSDYVEITMISKEGKLVR
jgi:ABC-type branched-subunit amino acid transport system substrate-binding protein